MRTEAVKYTNKRRGKRKERIVPFTLFLSAFCKLVVLLGGMFLCSLSAHFLKVFFFVVVVVLVFVFCLFNAAPIACGGSQARG